MYALVVMMAITTGTDSADFGRRRGCNGCNGCNGCYSSCHGCSGCYSSCHGCYSSCGGCYSSCGGCYGSTYSCHGISHGCYSGCGGCYGGHVTCGSVYIGCSGCGGVMVMPGGTTPEKVPVTPKGGLSPESATIVVTLPADASLKIDDHQTTSTSGLRRFTTPPLEQGKVFTYTLTASVPVNGKTETIVQKVTVQAGRESTAKLELPAATTVTAR